MVSHLTAASTMIYYSNGYDLEKRQQSEARIDRIGQKFPMTYIDIMAEDTVDERIVKALRKKINIASQDYGRKIKSMDLTLITVSDMIRWGVSEMRRAGIHYFYFGGP